MDSADMGMVYADIELVRGADVILVQEGFLSTVNRQSRQSRYGSHVADVKRKTMVETLLAKDVTLHDLRQQFGLRRSPDPNFFSEWQSNLPLISQPEKQLLDRVKQGYLNLVEYPPLLEKPIQIAILGPLLFLAGFFLPPFHIRAEQSTEIITEDEGTLIRGQLDLLLLKEQFWVMAIESKKFSYSIEAGLSQLLAYMLATPHPEKPGFGLIVTGGTFMFVKLIKGGVSEYGVSNEFALRNQGNDLYPVFQILKQLGSL